MTVIWSVLDQELGVRDFKKAGNVLQFIVCVVVFGNLPYWSVHYICVC